MPNNIFILPQVSRARPGFATAIAAWHNCILRIARRVLFHSNRRMYPGRDRLRRLLSLTPTMRPRNKMLTTAEDLVLKKNLLILAACWALAAAMPPARAQDETEKAIEKYRQMLKEDPWSNPG